MTFYQVTTFHQIQLVNHNLWIFLVIIIKVFLHNKLKVLKIRKYELYITII
jgi:hypothetical protein